VYAEEVVRVRGPDLLVKHVQQDVLGEVALHEDAVRAVAQHAQLARADRLRARRDERGGQAARVRPAVLRAELRERVAVMAQPGPDRRAVDLQQILQAGLVERDPVQVDPHVGRQPVRRRAGGASELAARPATGGAMPSSLAADATAGATRRASRSRGRRRRTVGASLRPARAPACERIGPVPVTHTTPGLRLVEHELHVPLDHARSDGEHITIFAREVADLDGLDRPLLLYLQGGPGHEAARPARHPSSPAWLDRALRDFRLLMLDQRGTGRSTPVGVLPGRTPAEQAEYLKHMRADAIVRDAECLRRALGVERWSVLGQSFGGMCVVSYLSLAPEGLREAFIAGGLPPLGARIDDVYRATYARTIAASRRYYERYPQDRARVRALLGRLRDDDLRLPGGDRLTPRRLRQLGAMLGMSARFEALHHILELDPDSPAFRHDVEAATAFARNPLYAILHEACWADGGATRWAAQRVRPAADYEGEPELFTGEHVYPWMFEDYGALAPLADAANLLAEHEWPRLYDTARLAANEVPVAAALYAEDMYVERAFSEETAAAIGGLRHWLTNELHHDGLRVDGERVLGRLIDMARGRV